MSLRFALAAMAWVTASAGCESEQHHSCDWEDASSLRNECFVDAAEDVCNEVAVAYEACGLGLDELACEAEPAQFFGQLDDSCEELERYRTFDLRVAAFIPCKQTKGPPLTGFFSGDGRGFDWQSDASSRLAANITFGPGRSTLDIGSVAERNELIVGASHAYSGTVFGDRLDGMGCREILRNGTLERTATASVEESISWDVRSYAVDAATGQGHMDLTLRFHGKLPLLPSQATPDITHHLDVMATWDGRGHYEVQFEGEHDPFPAHEVYLYDGRSWHQSFDRPPSVIQQFWDSTKSPLNLCFGLCGSPETYRKTCSRDAGDTEWSCAG